MNCLKKLFDDPEAGDLACECQCENNCSNKTVEIFRIQALKLRGNK